MAGPHRDRPPHLTGGRAAGSGPPSALAGWAEGAVAIGETGPRGPGAWLGQPSLPRPSLGDRAPCVPGTRGLHVRAAVPKRGLAARKAGPGPVGPDPGCTAPSALVPPEHRPQSRMSPELGGAGTGGLPHPPGCILARDQLLAVGGRAGGVGFLPTPPCILFSSLSLNRGQTDLGLEVPCWPFPSDT
ncbi:Hypothetical predicted protein [Marmota monax]|uniref:Uncharacterized protein n=1 Tax=Marmota monax TaxID=9995 RepID=A0A5E4AYB0_MARMO|nr:hypothetical protein GHT09_004486 [Marmota monax]VTJ62473.1 Hypothetical predicted protein [Marmota monax]